MSVGRFIVVFGIDTTVKLLAVLLSGKASKCDQVYIFFGVLGARGDSE